MTISFVTSTNTTYASRTNTTITAPTGLANGDLIVLGILTGVSGTAPTPTPPAGWTAVSGTPTSTTASGFNLKTWLYYRVASSEGSSWTWTHTTASSQGFALAYRGVDNTTPLDATPTVSTGTGATLTWTGLTTVTAGAMLVAIDHDWGDVAPVASDPTGYTQRFNLLLIYAADMIQATAGATGAPTRTCSSNTGDPWSAFLLALRPATSGALTGTLTAPTPLVTATLTGTQTDPGTLTAAVPRVTATLTGIATDPGTMAAATPRVTAAIADRATVLGTLAAHAPLATATITGSSTNPVVLTASVPVLTLSVGSISTLVDITVTVTLSPRRWVGTLPAPTAKTGLLNPRRWKGTLP